MEKIDYGQVNERWLTPDEVEDLVRQAGVEAAAFWLEAADGHQKRMPAWAVRVVLATMPGSRS